MSSFCIGSLGRRVAATVVLLTALCGCAMAQGEVPLRMFTAGVKMGLNVGDYRYTDAHYSIYKHSMTVNALAGAWVELRTKSGFAIRPEAAYVGRGVNLEWEDVSYRMRADCLDMRLGLVYIVPIKKTMLSPYFVVAPVWTVAMGGRVDYTDYYTGDIVMQVATSNVKMNDLGVFCGAGFEYPVHGYGWAIYLSGEAGYNWGLVNSFSKKEQTTEVTVMNPSLDQRPAMGSRFARGIEVTFRVGVPFGKVIKWRNEPKHTKLLFDDLD